MPKARILIVEDELIVVQDLMNRLRILGYDVVDATALGEQALVLAERLRPDLVLMDIRLKGEMDGIVAAKRIRQDFHLPIVFLTAFSEHDTIERAKAAEPFGYIIKPFEDHEIRATIEIALYKHQAEKKLQESERRYATTLASIGDGVIATDALNRVTFLNSVAERLTGWSLAEANGRPLREVFHITDEQTRQAAEDPVAKVLREGGTVGLATHTMLTSRDGREIPIDDGAAPIMDDHGQLSGTVLVFRDASERRQKEAELRESEARFRHVVESSPLAMSVANHDAAIEYINPKFTENFGYTIGDIPTLADWLQLAFPDPAYRQGIVERVRSALERPEHESVAAHGIEADVTCKDASVRTIEIFRSHTGNKTLTVYNDLTERKRMEEERRKLEVQMREVQKLESLGVLAGGFAHDFNNLLMAILGNVDLALLKLSPVSPACQHLKEITLASQRAADLCRQMLAYSGKGHFVVKRHDISEIVWKMGQMLDVSVSKKATIRYSLDEGLPAVESDASQIRQVIMNLITNASEAMGDTTGIITVTTGVMECSRTYLSESYVDDSLTGGVYVTLEVSDTGCGMDTETRARIFDPFFTTKFTGRGLGMAAVLGIVRGHKGAIKVRSEVGRGTTIKILLPAVK